MVEQVDTKGKRTGENSRDAVSVKHTKLIFLGNGVRMEGANPFRDSGEPLP